MTMPIAAVDKDSDAQRPIDKVRGAREGTNVASVAKVELAQDSSNDQFGRRPALPDGAHEGRARRRNLVNSFAQFFLEDVVAAAMSDASRSCE
jgi:hypothetical protein